jgi:hypothetical protein
VESPLPLHNFYSIPIRLPEPSSSEAEEKWVRNVAAEFLPTKHPDPVSFRITVLVLSENEIAIVLFFAAITILASYSKAFFRK